MIEAPDELRGQETVCPNCDATNVLRSIEDVALAEERERVAREAERRRFLGNLARAHGPGRGGEAPAGSIPLPPALGSGLAIQAGRRLQDISVYLLGFAYLFLILSLVLALVLVVGTPLSLAWKAVAALSAVLGGILAFVFLKFASDGVRALADATELLRSLEHRVSQLHEREGVDSAGFTPPAGLPLETARSGPGAGSGR